MVEKNNGPDLYLGVITGYTVPFSFIVFLTTLLPFWRVIRHFRAKRLIPPDHCPTCGHDLRATLDRCPECGSLPT